MAEKELDGVTLLGNQKTVYPTDYDPSVLERFPNRNPESDQIVGLDCFEFSSLCPKTHQPDMGTIHISYIPGPYMVESKSLKLYLFSFRNHGAFHEWCVDTIMHDLVNLLNPKYLEVYGDFNSRGGISILPFASYAEENYAEFKRCRQLAIVDTLLRHKR